MNDLSIDSNPRWLVKASHRGFYCSLQNIPAYTTNQVVLRFHLWNSSDLTLAFLKWLFKRYKNNCVNSRIMDFFSLYALES